MASHRATGKHGNVGIEIGMDTGTEDVANMSQFRDHTLAKSLRHPRTSTLGTFFNT